MKIASIRELTGVGLALLALLGTAGCAQVTTRSGVAGPALAGDAPLAIAAAPEGSGEADRLARDAVARALAQRGHAISADAPTRVEVALAERGAGVVVENARGGTISPARRHHLLQKCRRRTDRLTLAVYEDGRPGVTRVWAEEHHCHAALADSLPGLTARAVAALHDPLAQGWALRRGRD